MTESFEIRRRDLRSSLNYLAEQLRKAHDGLPESEQHHRVTILGVAVALGGIADQAAPAGACTATLRTEILGNPVTFTCRHPHGHTGAHQDDGNQPDDYGSSIWTDKAHGASHIDHAPDQCGSAATFDPGKPCILPPDHPYPKHRDEDGRGFLTNHTGDPQCPSI